ncbi:hypothetical protein [Actinoplanes sp. NPDC049802]|uniref:hypothetical protein n=1 Tax=Actinoplanes sp. NPDC049802 TaxID=3154742 RepID=UPI0033FC36D0
MTGDQSAADAVAPDYGLIAPITLPADGRIPDEATGVSSPAEYDGYFRLRRDRPDLQAWSRSCLDVQRGILADLALTDLSAEDRCDILAGCLVVLHTTLEHWVGVSGTRSREAA